MGGSGQGRGKGRRSGARGRWGDRKSGPAGQGAEPECCGGGGGLRVLRGWIWRREEPCQRGGVMQRWSGLLRVTMTRACGCSGSELGILAQGVRSNPSGGGARGRQWAWWDWPGGGTTEGAGGGFPRWAGPRSPPVPSGRLLRCRWRLGAFGGFGIPGGK